MQLLIEIDREADGRWICEIPTLPGVMTYGVSREDALAQCKALALRAIADRIEHGEAPSGLADVHFDIPQAA